MDENNVPDDIGWLEVTIWVFTTMNNFFQQITCEERWMFDQLFFFIRDVYGIINGPRPCKAPTQQLVKCLNLAWTHITVDYILFKNSMSTKVVKT